MKYHHAERDVYNNAMIAKPFLLDPGYEGTLDSSAFRERFWTRNSRSLAGGFVGFLFMYIPTAVLLIVGFSMKDPFFLDGALLGASIWSGAVTVMLVIFVLVYIGDLPRLRRMRQLTWEGNLVTGRIITCERKCYYGSSYKVEVHFAATAPSGKEVTHTQALERDDLLNEPLPSPGSPVLVLMVDETLFMML